jgi:hypothetical protein
MTALGEVFAVLACTDMRAALAGLSDLRGRLAAQPSQINPVFTGQGFDPSDAPPKNAGDPDERTRP